MNIRCPCCRTEFDLGGALDDDAGRQLAGLLAGLAPELARPLLAYAGLWRSATRALSWDRALRIVREALELGTDRAVLAAALAETVEAMREKQAGGAWKPLNNHNYLRRVLESATARAAGTALVPVASTQHAPEPIVVPRAPSAGLQGLAQLERLRRGQ